MGSPVALLCFPCWFGRFLGLFGSGAGAGWETCRWGGASGSAGRPRRGAPGPGVPPAGKSASRETPSPAPPPPCARSDSPASGPGRGSAHIWPPRSHRWDANPRTQMFEGGGESMKPKGGATAVWLLPVARAAGSRLGRSSRSPR